MDVWRAGENPGESPIGARSCVVLKNLLGTALAGEDVGSAENSISLSSLPAATHSLGS